MSKTMPTNTKTTGASAATRPLSLPAVKPRNPLVAAAHQRQAGAHGRSASALRHRADLALRRELHRERHDSP